MYLIFLIGWWNVSLPVYSFDMYRGELDSSSCNTHALHRIRSSRYKFHVVHFASSCLAQNNSIFLNQWRAGSALDTKHIQSNDGRHRLIALRWVPWTGQSHHTSNDKNMPKIESSLNSKPHGNIVYYFIIHSTKTFEVKLRKGCRGDAFVII